MSMTRGEAIDWFEQVRDIAKRNLGEKWTRGCEKHYQLKVDLAEAALTALRFPTREMVERMRGEWEWLGPCRDNKGVSWGTCSVCKTRQRLGDRLSFCPACGAPMTDEAAQMVMERLEVLHGETD